MAVKLKIVVQPQLMRLHRALKRHIELPFEGFDGLVFSGIFLLFAHLDHQLVSMTPPPGSPWPARLRLPWGDSGTGRIFSDSGISVKFARRDGGPREKRPGTPRMPGLSQCLQAPFYTGEPGLAIPLGSASEGLMSCS